MKHLLTRILLAASVLAVERSHAATFGEDLAFLKDHTEVIVLSDATGQAKLAIVPAWQGRAVTSTADGDKGRSFGWINRELVASGKLIPHMNAFGGEDRFWLGPEGGQFSIYFPKGAKFELANWQVPPAFDSLPFKTLSHSANQAAFSSEFAVTNYSGTVFKVGVHRELRMIDQDAAWKLLNLHPADNIKLVSYESENRITNRGNFSWKKDTGLLSIWILGMYTPAPHATIIVPIQSGPESKLGKKVTSDYFGVVPPDRLKVTEHAVFLAADGKYRSKIGINPTRSKGVLGAYDADHQMLTIVQFTQPKGVTDYVNSLWKMQDHAYGGDVANSYNDGLPAPGAKPMGPFFECESSSPAAALAPGQSLSHTHRTLHLTGPEESLDKVARAVFGISLDEIKTAVKPVSGTSN